ncbi:MAG: hypothetical protein KDA24_03775 [Deltaproteobacteria bacterium]|nr:hypothetical protein [Deltaproteobacteria bacterium]
MTLGLVGFPKLDVPVPERVGTSRDWEDPSNADLFRDVDHNPRDNGGYGGTVYAELGKQTYGR